MRIIAGQRRGHKFDGPRPKAEMRPTSDMVRESLFNIVGELMPGRVAVDLFAGTGAIGLEALSRVPSGSFSSSETGKAWRSSTATSEPSATKTAPRCGWPTPIAGPGLTIPSRPRRWPFFWTLPIGTMKFAGGRFMNCWPRFWPSSPPNQ